jgi:hypothetical protein
MFFQEFNVIALEILKNCFETAAMKSVLFPAYLPETHSAVTRVF